MKKCPKCGNPSYDGAPVCGNCGYNFPKPKTTVPKREDIFQQKPEVKKSSEDEDTVSIIKENKFTIGTILIITFIVICGIVFIGSSDSSLSNNGNLIKYDFNGFSFEYPESWQIINGSDVDHPGAKFYKNENNVTIEYYNITSTSASLRDITQSIINYAQENGAYVELVETVTLDGRNSSMIILENANGDYTKYISMFNNGTLYAFKITGDKLNYLETEDINATINSANIA